MQYFGVFVFIIVVSLLGVMGTFTIVYSLRVFNDKLMQWYERKMKDDDNDG